MSVALLVERKIPWGNFPVWGLYEWEVGIGLRGIVIFFATLRGVDSGVQIVRQRYGKLIDSHRAPLGQLFDSSKLGGIHAHSFQICVCALADDSRESR